MRVSFLIIFIILAFSLTAFGQNFVVKGSVSDINGPVRDAEVTLTNENGVEFKTKTDEEGRFQVDLPSAGRYSVSAFDAAMKRGNRGSSQTVWLGDESPATQVVNIELPTISELVIVAAGEEQAVEEISKTANVINAQEMRDREPEDDPRISCPTIWRVWTLGHYQNKRVKKSGHCRSA